LALDTLSCMIRSAWMSTAAVASSSTRIRDRRSSARAMLQTIEL
jgi:hypothetical protein